MIGERLSMRRSRKELRKLGDSNIDESILAGMTPEGRSLAIRVLRSKALEGVVIQISETKRKTINR